MAGGRSHGVDDVAAASLVGEVLLIAIIIVLSAGAGLALLITQDPPADAMTAEFRAELDCGGTTWSDGDEVFRIEHTGGEALDTTDLRIRVSTNGVAVTFQGAALSDDLADGLFSVGEAWSNVTGFAAGDEVEYQVIVSQDGVDQVATWRTVQGRHCGNELAPAVPLSGQAVAFRDVDCDKQYVPISAGGNDTEVNLTQLERPDGYYSGDACVVVPTSIGTLNGENVRIQSDRDIHFFADVIVDEAGDTSGSDENFGELILCAGGDIYAPGVRLESLDDDIEIAAMGQIDLTDATLVAAREISIGADTDTECVAVVDVEGYKGPPNATYEVIPADQGQPTRLHAQRAFMEAGPETLGIDVLDAAYLHDAELRAAGEDESGGGDGSKPDAAPHSVAIAIHVRHGELGLNQATFRHPGPAQGDNDHGRIWLRADGRVSLVAADLESTGEEIQVISDNSTIVLRSATLTSIGSGSSTVLEACVPVGQSVNVAKASFDDDDDTLQVQDGSISGTPDTGSAITGSNDSCDA